MPADLRRLRREAEDLIAQLNSVESRIASAHAYLAEPDCHELLGRAYLDRYRCRRTRLRALLRAVHAEARSILYPETADARALA